MNRRKELQNEFGLRERAMGVFEIVNGRDGKRYIASSPTLESAWQREKFMLDTGSHPNTALQQAYADQAGADFHYAELERLQLDEASRGEVGAGGGETAVGNASLNRSGVLAYRQALKQLERKWLETLQSYAPNGYNRQRDEA